MVNVHWSIFFFLIHVSCLSELNVTKLNSKELKCYHGFVMCKLYEELNVTQIDWNERVEEGVNVFQIKNVV